jgi:hypothetical protein
MIPGGKEKPICESVSVWARSRTDRSDLKVNGVITLVNKKKGKNCRISRPEIGR